MQLQGLQQHPVSPFTSHQWSFAEVKASTKFCKHLPEHLSSPPLKTPFFFPLPTLPPIANRQRNSARNVTRAQVGKEKKGKLVHGMEQGVRKD